MSTYLIWILGSKVILSNSQPSATLWGLDTCFIVGLRLFHDHLDHSFVVFENVQLRLALRRLCWWVRNPHLTIDQHLVCSFQLVFWSWFCCLNDLLSRTSFLGPVHLVLQCCLLNVTLQLPRSKGREQEVHPLAIQHPEK